MKKEEELVEVGVLDVESINNFSILVTFSELPGGKLVQFLMGFQNRGEKEFVVDFCETSFRYPQDFSYHIQNVSIFAIEYNSFVRLLILFLI